MITHAPLHWLLAASLLLYLAGALHGQQIVDTAKMLRQAAQATKLTDQRSQRRRVKLPYNHIVFVAGAK